MFLDPRVAVSRVAAQPAVLESGPRPLKTRHVLHSRPDEGCDTVYYRNGEAYKAKVISVTPTRVLYRYCDTPEGDVISVKRSKVSSIHYANGLTDSYSSVQPSTNNPDAPAGVLRRENNSLAVTSLVLGVVSVFVFFLGIPAVVTGIVAFNQIKRQPDRYTGSGYAIGGIVLGTLTTLTTLLLFYLLFALLLAL